VVSRPTAHGSRLASKLHLGAVDGIDALHELEGALGALLELLQPLARLLLLGLDQRTGKPLLGVALGALLERAGLGRGHAHGCCSQGVHA